MGVVSTGLLGFFLLWGGFVYFGRRYRLSWIISTGGGFIASLLIAVVVFSIVFKAFESPSPHDTVAQGSKRLTLDVRYQSSGLSNEQALRAMSVFVRACPGFGRTAAELTNIEITGPAAPHSEDRLRGWTRKYQLTFKIPDRPKSQELIDAFAMGHTCYYDLGGGNMPGINPYKTPCARICEMAPADYKDAVEMKFLDDPASEEYGKRWAALENEYRDNLALYEPPAMRNDYQAQRNLAYVLSRDSFKREDRVTGCAWRAYISKSHRKADSGDHDNLKIECGALTEEEKTLALAKANAIQSSVKR